MNKSDDTNREELRNRGAMFITREDRFGETRTGWFVDDVYLGPTVFQAMNAIEGN